MTLTLLSLTAATGVVLFLSGLPLWRPTLRRRVLGAEAGSRGGLREVFGGRWASPLSYQADVRVRLVWGGCAAGVVLVAAAAAGDENRSLTTPVILATVIAFFCGAALSRRISQSRAQRRLGEIEASLPAALDLLTIAVMSGESIQGALVRLSPRVGGELGALFDRLKSDLASGSDVAGALRDMGARAASPAVDRAVDALTVAMDKGAPVAEVLSGQAADLRAVRRARLLEAGGRREVLMLIPVVFLILPVVVLFALFPGLMTFDLLVP